MLTQKTHLLKKGKYLNQFQKLNNSLSKGFRKVWSQGWWQQYGAWVELGKHQ